MRATIWRQPDDLRALLARGLGAVLAGLGGVPSAVDAPLALPVRQAPVQSR